MPDITMCLNISCELRENCYRYRALPSKYRQSYRVNVPGDGYCEYFWNMSKRKPKDTRSTHESDRNNKEDFSELTPSATTD